MVKSYEVGLNTHVERRWKQGSKKGKPLGRPTFRGEYNRHETVLKVRIGFTLLTMWRSGGLL